MNGLKRIWPYLMACTLVVIVPARQGLAQQNSGASKPSVQYAPADRDGQHGFDFSIGTWKTRLSRLQHPLTGSPTWVEYDGTSVVRNVWDGRANLEEFEAVGPAGHIEGLTLRLYNPQSHQWNHNWATSNDGTVNQPMVGEFKNGRGEFFDQEPFKGRAIFVYDGFGRTSLRIRVVLNRHFRTMGAKLGK